MPASRSSRMPSTRSRSRDRCAGPGAAATTRARRCVHARLPGFVLRLRRARYAARCAAADPGVRAAHAAAAGRWRVRGRTAEGAGTTAGHRRPCGVCGPRAAQRRAALLQRGGPAGVPAQVDAPHRDRDAAQAAGGHGTGATADRLRRRRAPRADRRRQHRLAVPARRSFGPGRSRSGRARGSRRAGTKCDRPGGSTSNASATGRSAWLAIGACTRPHSPGRRIDEPTAEVVARRAVATTVWRHGQSDATVGAVAGGGRSSVELVQTNAPYRPAWVARLQGVRAIFRLGPYLLRLWRATRRADVAHVMANSGWAWHLFAAPAISIWRAAQRGFACGRQLQGRTGGGVPGQASRARATRSCATRPHWWCPPASSRKSSRGRACRHTSFRTSWTEMSSALPKTSGGRRAGPHLVVTRNLERLYGNDVALRAFAQVRQRFAGAHLSIAGSGPETVGIARLLRASWALRTRCVSPVASRRRTWCRLYRSADVVLNPVQGRQHAELDTRSAGLRCSGGSNQRWRRAVPRATRPNSLAGQSRCAGSDGGVIAAACCAS